MLSQSQFHIVFQVSSNSSKARNLEINKVLLAFFSTFLETKNYRIGLKILKEKSSNVFLASIFINWTLSKLFFIYLTIKVLSFFKSKSLNLNFSLSCRKYIQKFNQYSLCFSLIYHWMQTFNSFSKNDIPSLTS